LSSHKGSGVLQHAYVLLYNAAVRPTRPARYHDIPKVVEKTTVPLARAPVARFRAIEIHGIVP